MYYEIREQKIAYLKEKRNKELMRIKFIFAIVTLLVIFIVLAFVLPTRVSATSEIAGVKTEKYFKSLEVEAGDTLWSIASNMCEDEYTSIHYDKINDYIDELKEMNSIHGDTIHEGAHLTIAYYAPVEI